MLIERGQCIDICSAERAGIMCNIIASHQGIAVNKREMSNGYQSYSFQKKQLRNSHGTWLKPFKAPAKNAKLAPLPKQSKDNSYNHPNNRSHHSKNSSIDKIKAKLNEYLIKTQQGSLLNFQNEDFPQFARKSFRDHFRMTQFRTSLKKQNKCRDSISFQQPVRRLPQFNVSEACINPRVMGRQPQETGRLFFPKKEYLMQLREIRKPRSHFPTQRMEPFTVRQPLELTRERDLGLEPWLRAQDRYQEISVEGDN